MSQLLLLKGACLANGVSIDGEYDTLRTNLGHALVDKMLNPGVTLPPSTFSAPVEANGKRPAPSPMPQDKKKKRKPTNWHAFLREEKHKVHAGMPELKGHALISEVARRWKLHKLAVTGSSPPMLCDGSSSVTDSDSASDGGAVDGLTFELLEHSTAEEISHNLQVAGLQVSTDAETNARHLASQMVEL